MQSRPSPLQEVFFLAFAITITNTFQRTSGTLYDSIEIRRLAGEYSITIIPLHFSRCRRI